MWGRRRIPVNDPTACRIHHSSFFFFGRATAADGRSGQKLDTHTHTKCTHNTDKTDGYALWWVGSVTLDFPISLACPNLLFFFFGPLKRSARRRGTASVPFNRPFSLRTARLAVKTRLRPSPLVNYRLANEKDKTKCILVEKENFRGSFPIQLGL